MSKAGSTILLTLFLILVSGVSNKTFAQEKLPLQLLSKVQKNFTCTSLQDFLVTNNNCEDKKSSQVDAVVKALDKTQENTDTPSFSYKTDAVYYVAPTPTETPTPPLTVTVVPTMEVNPTSQTPLDNFPADQTQNLNSDLILEIINAHRASIGKPAFQKDANLCALAQTRSTELHDELFVKGGLHSGLYNRNLPYWITENAKYGSNEAGTVRWWLNSPIHRAAIEGDHIYSCGACQGTQCSQLFTSYTPKAGIATNTHN